MIDLIKESYAIALRDWQRSKWSFMTTVYGLILIVVMKLIGGGFSRIVNIRFYSQYFDFGILYYLLFSIGLFSGSEIVNDASAMIKLLLVAPISKFSLLFGKMLALFVNATKFYYIFGIALLIINHEITILKSIFLIVFIFFIVLAAMAFGLSISTLFPNKGIIMGILNLVILFLSGILFPVNNPILRINPFIYMIDLFRYIMAGISDYSIFLDFTITIVFTFSSIFLSAILFDKKIRN